MRHVAHPRLTSFCHAVSERARAVLVRAGHDLIHHDLYAEEFEPCLTAEEAYTVGDTLEDMLARATDPTIRQHREEIVKSQGLLVVHPNWWGKPPAMLSGWLDRVLVPGVAYRLTSASGLPEGLLSIRKALVFNTSDTPAERERGVLGDPLELIWGRCVLPFCGVKEHERHVFRPVVGSKEDERRGWLSTVDIVTAAAFPDTNSMQMATEQI